VPDTDTDFDAVILAKLLPGALPTRGAIRVSVALKKANASFFVDAFGVGGAMTRVRAVQRAKSARKIVSLQTSVRPRAVAVVAATCADILVHIAAAAA